jgi:hypothetical protein
MDLVVYPAGNWPFSAAQTLTVAPGLHQVQQALPAPPKPSAAHENPLFDSDSSQTIPAGVQWPSEQLTVAPHTSASACNAVELSQAVGGNKQEQSRQRAPTTSGETGPKQRRATKAGSAQSTAEDACTSLEPAATEMGSQPSGEPQNEDMSKRATTMQPSQRSALHDIGSPDVPAGSYKRVGDQNAGAGSPHRLCGAPQNPQRSTPVHAADTAPADIAAAESAGKAVAAAGNAAQGALEPVSCSTSALHHMHHGTSAALQPAWHLGAHAPHASSYRTLYVSLEQCAWRLGMDCYLAAKTPGQCVRVLGC